MTFERVDLSEDITLYRGDCLEVMPALPDMCADAIITDIPYGTTACKWDNVIPFAPMWEQVGRLCKGAFVTTASQPFTSALVMSKPEWFKYEWIWNKKNISNPFMANFQPLRVHENINVFSKGKYIYNPQKTDINKRRKWKQYKVSENYGGGEPGNEGETVGLFPKSIIEFSNAIRTGTHSTQKPLELYRYLIRTYTNEGDTVLDITMGSGTTIVAAVNTGRKAIGIELDQGYFDIAVKRIQEAMLQPRLI